MKEFAFLIAEHFVGIYLWIKEICNLGHFSKEILKGVLFYGNGSVNMIECL